MEKIEDARVLSGRYQNPVAADRDELAEVLVALRVVHVRARIAGMREGIAGVRDEGAARRAGVNVRAAVEVAAVRRRVRGRDRLEVERLQLPFEVAGAVVG